MENNNDDKNLENMSIEEIQKFFGEIVEFGEGYKLASVPSSTTILGPKSTLGQCTCRF